MHQFCFYSGSVVQQFESGCYPKLLKPKKKEKKEDRKREKKTHKFDGLIKGNLSYIFLSADIPLLG